MPSPELRSRLVDTLRLDLVGPWPGHPFSHELLPESPTRWYLTGYLASEFAPTHHSTDAEANDQLDAGADGGGLGDDGESDKAPAPGLFPSSIGLSVLVPADAHHLRATVTWGEYHWEATSPDEIEPDDNGLGLREEIRPVGYGPGEPSAQQLEEEGSNGPVNPPLKGFRRKPRQALLEVPLPAEDGHAESFPVPNSGGLRLVVTLRPVPEDDHNRLPPGTRAVCVFLVNGRPAAERAYQSFIYQACLELQCTTGFVPRPDLRGSADSAHGQDWDEDVADLQFRRAFDYASGIGCAAEPMETTEGGACYSVRTCWIPSAEVEFVGHLEAAAVPGVELRMEALATIASVQQARALLGPLVEHYRAWIDQQESDIEGESGLEEQRRAVANELVARARLAANRIEAGIELLAIDDVREAFCLANRAMARQARQREAQKMHAAATLVSGPTWRAFQLGFILLNLRGLHDPSHPDRAMVDLLFFPTGGGKTEAYLGLAAFSLVLRRLRNPGRRGAGVNVLMRYTLRLLTLDQLSRASALICALELERQERYRAGDKRLGDWPFEIGLWVGSAATPNRMGRKGDKGPGRDKTAYTRYHAFRSHSRTNPSPIPLENCPWCGTKFEPHSFRLIPIEAEPEDLRISCVSPHCEFRGDRPLPIVAVDEPIYRRLPGFLIATVDKFAALPWMGPSGKLFGLVERYDDKGFYSAAEPGFGKPLGGPLPPPELIIQDELHLISGPLGTVAGIYETAIGCLSERDLGNGQFLRPKIVASTATVRQAENQIRALFARPFSRVFPPSGPNRRDSFFARTHPPEQSPARLYLGIGAQGRSLKVVLLRTALALLSAGQTLYLESGCNVPNNPADPYMTALGYFNSLRELGGSRRIVEDEITSRLRRYGSRRRRDPVDTLFSRREIGEPLELTSRVSTNQVSEAKRRLGQSASADDRVDVALATNMISVGLDITRLGLMLVLGQPKSSAEYIQATSRVGRDPQRPGLVVTLLNVHKPRDRSHYERFGYYHSTFYRAVEATSITPFSPRAMDRALASAVVSLARHWIPGFGEAMGASAIQGHRTELDRVIQVFAERAAAHRSMSPQEETVLRGRIRDRCHDLLDTWYHLSELESNKGARLQYGTELTNQPSLLHGFLDESLLALPQDYRKFRSNRSMRDVEPSVELFPENLV